MDGLTRRGFVVRSGMTLGAVGALGLPWDAAAAEASLALSPARQRTYGALVATLAAANGMPSDDYLVASASEHFTGWYASLPTNQQQHVESVLDAMEGAAAEGFSRGTASTRLVTLSEWRHAPAQGNASEVSAQSLRRRAFAQHAISYASPPYGPTTEMKYVPLPVRKPT